MGQEAKVLSQEDRAYQMTNALAELMEIPEEKVDAINKLNKKTIIMMDGVRAKYPNATAEYLANEQMLLKEYRDERLAKLFDNSFRKEFLRTIEIFEVLDRIRYLESKDELVKMEGEAEVDETAELKALKDKVGDEIKLSKIRAQLYSF